MIAFDSRGAYFAFGFFALMALSLLIAIARERRVASALSVRARITCVVIPLAGCMALLYWWLFWHRFYRVGVADGRIELLLALPPHHVSIPAGAIARIATEPGGKFQRRVVIETTDGTIYYSPEGSQQEIQAVRVLIEGARGSHGKKP